MMHAKVIVIVVTSLLLVFGAPATIAAEPEEPAPASLEESSESSGTPDASAGSVRYPRPGGCTPCPKVSYSEEREGNCTIYCIHSNTGQNPYTCECRYGPCMEIDRMCDDPAEIC